MFTTKSFSAQNELFTSAAWQSGVRGKWTARLISKLKKQNSLNYPYKNILQNCFMCTLFPLLWFRKISLYCIFAHGIASRFQSNSRCMQNHQAKLTNCLKLNNFSMKHLLFSYPILCVISFITIKAKWSGVFIILKSLFTVSYIIVN